MRYQPIVQLPIKITLSIYICTSSVTFLSFYVPFQFFVISRFCLHSRIFRNKIRGGLKDETCCLIAYCSHFRASDRFCVQVKSCQCPMKSQDSVVRTSDSEVTWFLEHVLSIVHRIWRAYHEDKENASSNNETPVFIKTRFCKLVSEEIFYCMLRRILYWIQVPWI